MKFIHIADVHLGAKPDKGKPWAAKRESHSWQAFIDVVTKAKEESAQLLLIAGNLYHRQPLLKELKEVNRQFARIPNTQVVIIAGNCDYLSPNSCYSSFPWEKNVHFLKEEKISCIELPGIQTRVYGLSYQHREITSPLYRGIEVKKGDCTNILLAHGGDEKHIPFQASDFREMEFDYVAFGHLHKPMQLADAKVVMAGALQPIECSDVGQHGYFMGEIKNHMSQVRFYPIHYCEYVPLKLKISREIAEDVLKKFVEDYVRKAPPYQLFRITLTGTSNPKAPSLPQALGKISRVAQVLDQCQAGHDLEQLKVQHGQQILGRYIDMLERMPQDEITKKALYYGVEALMVE
ncbi:MAG: DNA repair exonuclease [Lachnospiraceae bacterium]|nr:DNA repair exonuclease [Lachnospiraceae bacterium]